MCILEVKASCVLILSSMSSEPAGSLISGGSFWPSSVLGFLKSEPLTILTGIIERQIWIDQFAQMVLSWIAWYLGGGQSGGVAIFICWEDSTSSLWLFMAFSGHRNGVASLSTWRLSKLETCSSVGINVIMGSWYYVIGQTDYP